MARVVYGDGASAVTYSARGTESIESAAYSVAEQVLSPDNRAQNIPCGKPETIDPIVFRTWRWATSAWRRPRGCRNPQKIIRRGKGVWVSLMKPYSSPSTIIQSPFFLFWVELALLTKFEKSAVVNFELAARLSFFLWNMPPDEALMQAALDGTLIRDSLFEEADAGHPNARQGLRALR